MSKLRASRVYVRSDDSATSTSWLSEFEARAIAAEYLREEAAAAEDSIGELTVFLCRGGGVELLGGYQHGERGPFVPIIAGDEATASRLRQSAREQMRRGVMSDFRLCRFVNAEQLEVIGRDWKVVE